MTYYAAIRHLTPPAGFGALQKMLISHTSSSRKYAVNVSAGLALDQGDRLPAHHHWDLLTPVCRRLHDHFCPHRGHAPQVPTKQTSTWCWALPSYPPMGRPGT